MSEIGTLKELQAQPGDVVEYVDSGEETTIVSIRDGRYYGDGQFPNCPYVEDGAFRIVSRAKPAETGPDLTAITTPYGLLDEATRSALFQSNGPYQMLTYSGDWLDKPCLEGKRGAVWRVKPEPVRETVELRPLAGSTWQGSWNGKLVVDLIDGKPDLSTVREAR